MKKKLKIDEIYRQKLKGVETTPPSDSWEHILAGLPEKKPRKILPIWFTLAGTAAALAILFTLYNSLFLNPSSSSSSFPLSNEQGREIFDPDPTSDEFKEYMRQAAFTLEEIRNRPVGDQNSSSMEEPGGHTRDSGLNQIAQGHTEESTKTDPNPNGNELAALSPAENEPSPEKGDNAVTVQIPLLFKYHPLIKGQIEISASDKHLTITEEEKAPTLKNLKENEERSAEEIAETSSLSNRFSLTPNAAAVYMGKMGNGDLLVNQFAGREDGGEISVSYGVNLAYQLSERLKVRSGLHKVDFSYNTHNLNYSAVLDTEAVNVMATQAGNAVAYAAPGSLSQGFGFLEIPLELEYALIKKRLELNVIGGASTFILDKNRVSFSNGTATANLGEATNLNDLSLSANIGMGLNYRLSRQFHLNLEPLFKYQINTFYGTSDANSYYFGIYSGLRFRF